MVTFPAPEAASAVVTLAGWAVVNRAPSQEAESRGGQPSWPGGAAATPRLTIGPIGAWLPAFGSSVRAIVAPAGVVAGRVVNDAVPFASTGNPPTARGA